ncbi:MAG: hypothetical protein U1D55_07630 [Phycisphaerae bacterium]
MKWTILLGTLAVLALLARFVSATRGAPAAVPQTAQVAPVPRNTAASRPAAPVQDMPARVPFRGMALQLSSAHQAQTRYLPLLREIAALGANTVLLSVSGEMEHAKSQAIFIDARKTPSPADLVTILQQARELGLQPFVMPIVLLSHPRGSEWRGVIEPPDWDEWWRDYRDFVLHFADAAGAGGAAGLMVGSELVSTEKSTDEWVRIIAAVRERFGGKLGYSANWDHYKPIKFWDKLDFVGMTSYYTLADRDNPSVDEIVKRWQPIRDELTGWSSKIGKPILLTEVGWCSQEGAARAPWNYYQNQHATTAGHEEQRRLYEAFIKVWGDAPELTGVTWWEWSASPGGVDDFGYTPKGKPAEKLLREWFAATRRENSAGATNGNALLR